MFAIQLNQLPLRTTWTEGQAASVSSTARSP